MIEFTKLSIKNFLSFGEKQTLPLAHQHVVRIEGINKDDAGADSNMAGKSSLMEAILWCLYGRTIRGLKHDAVVNRFVRRNCCVSVHFDKDNSHFIVRRYRRDKTYSNQLQLWQGNQLRSYRHEAQTQAKLESILGCDYQSFSNTVVFGGTKPFALLTDAEQKKVLESFLGFEKFEAALHLTKDRLTEAREKKHGIEINIEKISGRVQGLQEKLATLQKSATIFQETVETDSERIHTRLSKLKEPNSGPSRKELEDASEAVEAFVVQLSKVESRAHQLRKRVKAASKSIRDKEKLVGKPCPTCGQKISARTVEEFLEHLAADKHAARKDLRVALVHHEKLERRLRHARSRLKRVADMHQRAKTLQVTYERTRRDLEKQLKRITLHDQPSPFAAEIEQTSIRYSKHLSNLLVKQYEERALEQRIKGLEFWEVGFGNQGVKALIVREALPTLNLKLTEFAREVFKGGTELEFKPSKENRKGESRELFHIHYASKRGSGTYLGESSGGRKRVDVCVLLCFSWLSRTCNVLLVDELLDGLDESGREAVLNILARMRGTVLVISHRRELKAKIGKVWTVVKEKGFSTLEKVA